VGGARDLARNQGAGSPECRLSSYFRACAHFSPGARARASRLPFSSIPLDEAQLVAAELVPREYGRRFLGREGKVARTDEMVPRMNVGQKERGCWPPVRSVEDVATVEVAVRGPTSRVECEIAEKEIRGLVAAVDSADPHAWDPNVAGGLLAARVGTRSFGKALCWCRDLKCEGRDRDERL
jgi:hypothetical protein